MSGAHGTQTRESDMSGQPRGLPGPALFCESTDARPAEEVDGRNATHLTGDAGAAGRARQWPTDAIRPEAEQLYRRVVAALSQIYDPEIPVNIYELGLIYDICIYPLGRVVVHMTLTSPACPVAGSLPPDVERTVASRDGVTDATVELVWEPPWSVEMMSEEARLELNLL
jgi:FeS assembly SUF system protein